MRHLAWLCALCITATTQAREVDHYLAWGTDLRDEGPTVDSYMREKMTTALGKLNAGKFITRPTGKAGSKREQTVRDGYFSCGVIAHDMMKEAFFSPTYQKIESYLDNDPNIDRYPRRPTVTMESARPDRGQTAADGYMTDDEYLDASIVQHSPMNVPLSRVVNLYGIYTGADKLGHFTSFGVRYLDKLRDSILQGVPAEEAFYEVLEAGYGSERSIVGMTFTAVFSRGDLEANYQGLQFAYSLCKGDSKVRLAFDGANWELIGLADFTMRDYLNPDWDESWNTSIFKDSRREKDVTVRFEEENYCEVLDSDWVRQQREFYATFSAESTSKRYEEKLLPEIFPDQDPYAHSLTHYCASRSN